MEIESSLFSYFSPLIFFTFHCSICGTLHSVDQYLNIRLTDISVTDPEKHPHMVRIFLVFSKLSNTPCLLHLTNDDTLV